MELKMKKNKKYKYVQASSTTAHGSRTYDVHGIRLPSVTTILDKTKNKAYLNRWRNKVGHEEAERIKNYSSKRGTAMHKFIEKYIQESGFKDLTPIGQQAEPMAKKIIESGLTPVTEYYGSEVTLYYPGLYAGSSDLVCVHDKVDTIVDFKQANSPKKKEWIEDYYLQIAAYAMAHDYVYESNIEQGIIMVCTPDLYYQEFKFSGADLRSKKHKFLKRLDEYYEIMKEQKIDNKELLNEFEKNKI
jgi:genome maintenance exonuclease 1